MKVLNTFLCKKFRDEELFLEKVQDVLDYEIVEYTYIDSFELLGNVYYRMRIKLENNFIAEFVYYFLEDEGICILDIDY